MNNYLKFIRHSIAGLISTLFAYISFPILYSVLGKDANFSFSFLVSSACNILVSYSLQRVFVFKSKKYMFNQFLIFIIMAIVLSVFSYYFMKAILTIFGMSAFIANTISVTIFSLISFIINQKVTFSDLNK